MKKGLAISIAIILLSSPFLRAQNAEQTLATDSLLIRNIISDVFDGMRTNDSSKISQHLLNTVVMHSVGVGSDGNTKIFTESKAEAWLQAVAQPKEQVWDERVQNIRMQITQGLASVWMDYEFYVDDNFSHCGVNSFQLVQSMGKWKIIYIIDTRKRKDCKN